MDTNVTKYKEKNSKTPSNDCQFSIRKTIREIFNDYVELSHNNDVIMNIQSSPMSSIFPPDAVILALSDALLCRAYERRSWCRGIGFRDERRSGWLCPNCRIG